MDKYIYMQKTKGAQHHTTPRLLAKFQMVLVNGICSKFLSNGGKIYISCECKMT